MIDSVAGMGVALALSQVLGAMGVGPRRLHYCLLLALPLPLLPLTGTLLPLTWVETVAIAASLWAVASAVTRRTGWMLSFYALALVLTPVSALLAPFILGTAMRHRLRVTDALGGLGIVMTAYVAAAYLGAWTPWKLTLESAINPFNLRVIIDPLRDWDADLWAGLIALSIATTFGAAAWIIAQLQIGQSGAVDGAQRAALCILMTGLVWPALPELFIWVPLYLLACAALARPAPRDPAPVVIAAMVAACAHWASALPVLGLVSMAGLIWLNWFISRRLIRPYANDNPPSGRPNAVMPLYQWLRHGYDPRLRYRADGE